MIFTEQWIREWVNPPIDTPQLTELLTMAGLEVDSCTPVANVFKGIVVAEVTRVGPHPDADKLHLCQVSDGEQSLQVVCGAPNVRAGMKVPFARIDAQIQGRDGVMTIRKAKLRGVESNGMLCSASELGLEEKSDGLLVLPADAPLGVDIRQYLKLDDCSIELDLTPNRGDCLGIMGLARELGVLTRTDVRFPAIDPVSATIEDTFKVAISAAEECPRYLGRVIRGIDPAATTPLWMQEKLRRCGLRSIDPIVDVTNFTLLELGQPLHAFDLGKLRGAIDVRLARDEEKITLLDGKTLSLASDTLVIADGSGAVAIAGVMGGQGTAVSDSTRDVFLECAYFSPRAIAGRARKYGMHTDASHRYERGVDHAIQQRAIERATGLILEIAGGSAGPVTETSGNLPTPRRVRLRYAAARRLLGISIPENEIRDILVRLGLELVASDPETLEFIVPSFRFDIELEADLIEELARVYGYSRLPKSGGLAAQMLKSRPEKLTPVQTLKRQLVDLGYQEAVTYSFIDPQLSATLLGPDFDPIALSNPISSEMSVMRGSLIPGLLVTLSYNDNRQQSRARLFETGLVFLSEGGATRQPARVAGLITGTRFPVNWSNNKDLVDFYDLKGDVETLLSSALQGELHFVPGSHPALHAGQCAEVFKGDVSLGFLGSLHPAIQRRLGLLHPVFLFELDLVAVQERSLPRARELSRYPEVSRDLAIVVENEIPAAEILSLVQQNAGDCLTDLRIFDVYQGDALGKNKKSVALGLTWQHPSRTLSDDEINAIITNCVKALEQQFNANLRT